MRVKLVLSAFALSASMAFPVDDVLAQTADPHGEHRTGSAGTSPGTGMTAPMAGMAHPAVEATGDPDVDFARMMIPHHEGAVAMAEELLKDGSDEELMTLARGIIRTQNEEIDFLEAWLAQHEDR